jgi:hypothetical protein
MTNQFSVATLRSADELTPAVLTTLLRRTDPDIVVTEVDVQRTWQGTTSHLYVKARYADPNTSLPRELFVKTQLNTVQDLPDGFDETLDAGGGMTMLLIDETKFYRDIRPSLEVETMAVYFADLLDGPSQFLIVAEDISGRGAQVPDAVEGLTVAQVDQLLATLSQIHAPFWDSPRLADGGDLAWLQHPVSGPWADFTRTQGFAMIKASLEVPYKKDLLNQAGADPDGLERGFWALQERIAAGPATLLHGDPHPRNTYVLPDGRVGVLDWQLVRRGSWLHDVGYAIVGALEPSLRREHERELLESYRRRLVEAEVRSVPDHDEMWTSYRATPAWGFAMWAITPDQMYSVEVVSAVLRRFAEAYSDLGTGRLLR